MAIIKYAGIGSREIDEETRNKILKIGQTLAKQEHLLRSGGAAGSDLAFEQGCDSANGLKEIYLPWPTFGSKWERPKSNSDIAVVSPKALKIIKELTLEYGDYNQKCKDWMWKLTARNVHQILGKDLNDPVSFVVCYTKNGEEIGGTRWALRLAKKMNIPVYNLGKEN